MSRAAVAASAALGFALGGISGAFAGRELEKHVGGATALSKEEAYLGGGVIGALVGSVLFAVWAAGPEEVKVVGTGTPPLEVRFP